jgi:NAD(P)-dependent dehydrogenase (short-subunit alcohol dehydrogenase family)
MANDKVAVVAGVGRGIGARFVETFAQGGYRVAALARNANSLEEVRKGLGATAERCVFWATDITDQDQVKKTFARVRGELGPVNLLICNAGGGVKRGSFLDVSPQDFLKNLHGQAFGPFLCAKEAIPEMMAHGGGTVAYIGATSSVNQMGATLMPAKSSLNNTRSIFRFFRRECENRGLLGGEGRI